MNRAELTALYLDEVKRRGIPARDLIGSQANSDVLNAFDRGRYLTRPCSSATTRPPCFTRT